MNDSKDEQHVNGKTTNTDLQPLILLATGIISAVGGAIVASSVDVIKSRYNAESLKPDNNIHIYALEASAVNEACTLNPNLLKSMAGDAESLKALDPKDKFSIETFAKNNINKVESDQISGGLLQELKAKGIATCTSGHMPLDSLQIAVVVERQTPYIYKRPCDVLYRPSSRQSESIKIGEVDIHVPASGTTSPTTMRSNNDVEKFKILKDSYASFKTLRITPAYDANIVALNNDLKRGYLNIGLRCEILYDKELKPKDVDYRNAPRTKL